MITARFRSLGWVAAVAVSALACYLVTQRVAGERIQLSRVSRQILTAERDRRRLATEIETRSRMPQLERWNEDVLALSAPQARQFLPDPVQLASLEPMPGHSALPLNPTMAPPASVRQAAYRTAAPPAVVDISTPDAAPALLRHATYDKPPADKVAARPTDLALESDAFSHKLDELAALEAKHSGR